MKQDPRIYMALAVLLALAGGVWVWQNRQPVAPADVNMVAPPVLPRLARAPVLKSGPKAQPKGTIADRVHAVVSGTNFWARRDALRHLPKDLSAGETEALSELLFEDLGASVPRGALLAFQNDLMSVLREQAQPPQLTDILIDLYHDEQADIALRDYALQHLASWHEDLSFRTQDPAQAAAGQKAIKAVLTEALSETATSLAGTALLSLHHLARAGTADMDAAAVARAAGQFVNDPAVGELTKITAIQVCAGTKNGAALPGIIQLARSAASVPTQLSAIAAIGALGEQGERPVLQSLATHSDSRIRTAATVALARMDARVSTRLEG